MAAFLLLVVAWSLAPTSAQEPNSPARISGRVVAAETGQPLRGAMVQLTGGSSQTTPVSTDLDGRFVLAERRIGRYALQVSKPGYVPSVFGRFADSVDYFEVLAGQKIDRGTIRLRVAAVISGRVQNELGEPVADASVTAWRVEFPQPGIRMWRQVQDTSTNDLGDFRLHGLMPGRYHVVASRSPLPPESFVRNAYGAVYVVASMGESAGLPHISEPIVVDTMRGGETSGTAITLAKTQYARVTGSVIDSDGRPASSASVMISPAHSEGLPGRRGAQVGARAGLFTFNSVPVGEYRLTASAFGITPRGAPLPESASLAITVHEDLDRLVLQTQTTPAQVQLASTGRVFIDGAPATATRIQVLSWPRDENAIAPEAPDVFSLQGGSSVTKADGQFAFGGVAGWVILQYAGSPALALKSVTAGGVDVTDGFDMKRASGTFEVHLTSQVSTISGVVKDAEGGAVAACDVVVYAADPASWKLPFSRRVVLVRADEKGEFRVTGLPGGQYLAAAPADLDRAMWADPDRLERWRAVATPLSITDGEKATIALKRN
jgi:Carboxypeptidase regulatory-like domain